MSLANCTVFRVEVPNFSLPSAKVRRLAGLSDGEDGSGVMFGLAGSSAVGGGFGTRDVRSSAGEAGSWTDVSQPSFLQVFFLFVFIVIRIYFMAFNLYTSACMYL